MSDLKPISVVVAVAVLCFLVWNTRRLRARKTTFGAFGFWCIISLGVMTGFLFPQLIDPLPGLVGMGNKIFFVAVTSILVLFGLTFVVYDITKKNELRTMRLIQQVSLLAATVEELGRERADANRNNDSGV